MAHMIHQNKFVSQRLVMYTDTIVGHLIMHSMLKLIGVFYIKGSLNLKEFSENHSQNCD